MKDLTVLKKECMTAMQDPKFLLAALLLQLGGKAVIEHEFIVQAVCEFHGECFCQNSKEGYVLTMKANEKSIIGKLGLKKKSPLDDENFLNKLSESPHVSRA